MTVRRVVGRSDPRWRRARCTLAALLAALLAVMAPLAAGCSAGSGGSGSSAAPKLSDVRALLARHGAAVRAHSAKAFLADVDPTAHAKDFHDRQAAELDNLAEVPLHTWTYTLVSAVTDTAAQAAATKRYGTRTLIARVTLAYELTGIDGLPDQHDLWLSFVRRGGHTYLAGDDDLTQSGGTSWRGPWDFGPVLVQRGTASLVLGHVQNAAQLAALARVADAAIPVVTSVWGTGWSRRLAVIAPASTAELQALVGAGSTVADVSAVAVTAGDDPLTGKPYGQRLVLNPGALGNLSAVGERIVVQHEITHLATEPSTAETTPRWVVEGFADYVGNLGSGESVRSTAAELAAELKRGSVPSRLPGDGEFASSNQRLAQVYEEAWLACRLIAARDGQAGLVRFYRIVGTAVAPGDAAVAAGLSQVLRESLAAFTAQWRSYLTAQLG